MKKIFCLLTAALLMLGFAGCSDDDDDGGMEQSGQIVPAVTQLKASADATSVTLTWRNPKSKDFSYVTVAYKREGMEKSEPEIVDAGATSYTVEGLSYEEDKPYSFYVQSFSKNDKPGKTAKVVANCTKGDGPEPPVESGVAAVTNLKAVPMRGGINLSWTDPKSDEFDHVVISYVDGNGEMQEISAYPGEGEGEGTQILGLLQKWGSITFTVTSFGADETQGKSTTVDAECLHAELVREEYSEEVPYEEGSNVWQFWTHAYYGSWANLQGQGDPDCKADYEQKCEEYNIAHLVDGDPTTNFSFINNYNYVWWNYNGNLWGYLVVSQPWIDIDINAELLGTFKGVNVTLQNATGNTAGEIDFPITWDVYVWNYTPEPGAHNWASPDTGKEWMRHTASEWEAKCAPEGVKNNWTLWKKDINTAQGLVYSNDYDEAAVKNLSGASFKFQNICMPDGTPFNHVRLALMMGQDGWGGVYDAKQGDKTYTLNLSHCKIAEMKVELVKERVTNPEAEDPTLPLTQEEIDEIENQFK